MYFSFYDCSPCPNGVWTECTLLPWQKQWHSPLYKITVLIWHMVPPYLVQTVLLHLCTHHIWSDTCFRVGSQTCHRTISAAELTLILEATMRPFHGWFHCPEPRQRCISYPRQQHLNSVLIQFLSWKQKKGVQNFIHFHYIFLFIIR